jgi:hypothetical protein
MEKEGCGFTWEIPTKELQDHHRLQSTSHPRNTSPISAPSFSVTKHLRTGRKSGRGVVIDREILHLPMLAERIFEVAVNYKREF